MVHCNVKEVLTSRALEAAKLERIKERTCTLSLATSARQPNTRSASALSRALPVSYTALTLLSNWSGSTTQAPARAPRPPAAARRVLTMRARMAPSAVLNSVARRRSMVSAKTRASPGRTPYAEATGAGAGSAAQAQSWRRRGLAASRARTRVAATERVRRLMRGI
jgi:hypothetical protein